MQAMAPWCELRQGCSALMATLALLLATAAAADTVIENAVVTIDMVRQRCMMAVP